MAVELCFGSPSLAPAKCFDEAPDFLVEITTTAATAVATASIGGATTASSSVTNDGNGSGTHTPAMSTTSASISLRAALCTDADDEGPAKCAASAADYTPAVLSPATIVSLCHGKRRAPSRPRSFRPQEFAEVSSFAASTAHTISAAILPLSSSLGTPRGAVLTATSTPSPQLPCFHRLLRSTALSLAR